MSSIPVGGDVGDLFFAAGSFIIVLLGLPGVRWFVAGVVVVGVMAAGVLFLWRAAHPSALSSSNSILAR
jgi:hypothetical protein